MITIIDICMDKAHFLGHRDVSAAEGSTELIIKCVVSKYYHVYCYTPGRLPVYIQPSFIFTSPKSINVARKHFQFPQ